MSGDQRESMGRQIPAQDLQISAAHSGGLDLISTSSGPGSGSGRCPAAISSTAVMVTACMGPACRAGGRFAGSPCIVQTSTAAPYARAMEQFLSRRGLLAGGGASVCWRPAPQGSTSTSASASGTPSPSGAAGPNPGAFRAVRCSVFNDEALALGAAAARTAEVGEVLMTAQAITQRTGNPQDPTKDSFTAYVEEFRRTGAPGGTGRQRSRGGLSADCQCPVSALQHVQRPSPVLRPRWRRPKGKEADFDRCDTAWQAALDSWDVGVERFEVTGAGHRIPCYFLSPAGNGRRPTVIISEGSDGQNVETMQFGVRAGLERGYNVVLFGTWPDVVVVQEENPVHRAVGRSGLPIVKGTCPRRRGFGGRCRHQFRWHAVCACGCPDSQGWTRSCCNPGPTVPALWGDQKDVDLVRSVQDAPEAEQRKAAED